MKTRFVGAIRKVWSLKLNLIMPCSFPWKCICKVKVPHKVAFLSWTATLGKILTIDNLHHRWVSVLDCCYMYKRAGETVDHLLLHGDTASEFWSFVFFLFGLSWVMPSRVIDLLACWKGSSVRKVLCVIWRAVPLCLMWMLWRERNRTAFEDSEKSSLEPKMIFLRVLCDWMDALSGHSFPSILDFVDSCFPCLSFFFFFHCSSI